MKQNGFTSIEHMLALVIIGLLASVAVPAYMNASVGSKLSNYSCTKEEKEKATEEYRWCFGFGMQNHYDCKVKAVVENCSRSVNLSPNSTHSESLFK